LEGEQVELNNPDDIETHITKFYKQLFGAGPQRSLKLSPTFLAYRPKLSKEEGSSLVREFEEEEVRSAMFSMKSASAPGLNGFGVQFFKSFWPVIGKDYLALFNYLHKGC
jgi:hypothetical protein